LQEGNLPQAQRLTNQARAMKVEFKWYDDTPDKVQGDIQRAQGGKPAAPTAVAATSDDPRVLLKQGRDMFSAGKYDEAMQLARKAKTKPTRWGLFEDSPDKLLADTEKARARHNDEEAVKSLADGR